MQQPKVNAKVSAVRLTATKPYPPHSTTVWLLMKSFASLSCGPPPSCTLIIDRGRIRARKGRTSASVRSARSASLRLIR